MWAYLVLIFLAFARALRFYPRYPTGSTLFSLYVVVELLNCPRRGTPRMPLESTHIRSTHSVAAATRCPWGELQKLNGPDPDLSGLGHSGRAGGLSDACISAWPAAVRAFRRGVMGKRWGVGYRCVGACWTTGPLWHWVANAVVGWMQRGLGPALATDEQNGRPTDSKQGRAEK